MNIRMNGKHIALSTIQVGQGAIVSYVDETEKIVTIIGYCYSAND